MAREKPLRIANPRHLKFVVLKHKLTETQEAVLVEIAQDRAQQDGCHSVRPVHVRAALREVRDADVRGTD